MQYIYLHGFASGNNAKKANFFKSKFAESGIDLLIPDLNENDFANLTMTRQINFVKKLVDPSVPVILLGSSMGGLLALILAQELNNINKLILFAPALQMVKRWTSRKEEVEDWKQSGSKIVYHYGYKKNMPLNYSFINDLAKHEDEDFTKEVPTLIFHGTQDTAVPHIVSVKYAKGRDHVYYHELESDHSLENQLDYMWQEIKKFIK
ncbi:MAG: esterase [Burkholderiales bacterium]|jgi:alpha-beta hydrolase superfamily lysophospholipase|nr:esterase [Burkholderiales bacterium]